MACTPYETYIIGDVNADLVAACEQRLRGTGAAGIDALVGPVSATVRTATSRLQRTGLHFAFLDPFNADLPFDVIQELGELPKMDQLIHFSIMDFKRNLHSMKEDGRLDALAPGWSSAVRADMGIDQQRISIFRFWRGLLESKLKYKVSNRIVKVRGPNRAEIYWLIFAARHDLGGRLWKEIADLSPQPQRELQL
jgi:three-Cys-motif partner protein